MTLCISVRYLFFSEIFDEERYRQEEEMARDNRRVQAISWGRGQLLHSSFIMFISHILIVINHFERNILDIASDINSQFKVLFKKTHNLRYL